MVKAFYKKNNRGHDPVNKRESILMVIYKAALVAYSMSFASPHFSPGFRIQVHL